MASAPTRLLNVAAGPGRYLQELLQDCGPEQGDLHILCRDLSRDGLLLSNLLLAIGLLPLLAVHSKESLWIVYIVLFLFLEHIQSILLDFQNSCLSFLYYT